MLILFKAQKMLNIKFAEIVTKLQIKSLCWMALDLCPLNIWAQGLVDYKIASFLYGYHKCLEVAVRDLVF